MYLTFSAEQVSCSGVLELFCSTINSNAAFKTEIMPETHYKALHSLGELLRCVKRVYRSSLRTTSDRFPICLSHVVIYQQINVDQSHFKVDNEICLYMQYMKYKTIVQNAVTHIIVMETNTITQHIIAISQQYSKTIRFFRSKQCL